MSNTQSPFRLAISLSALEHLGINLYSSIPAVLSGIIANAWDADATRVDVTLDDEGDTITILDDGCGMSPNDINTRFLKVGYRRREKQPGPTPYYRRSPMGRKGIGKLSLFSIARVVTVETATGEEKSALMMSLSDIRSAISSNGGAAGTYQPTVLSTDRIDFSRGTRITLTKLRKGYTTATFAHLRSRIARRFSIIDDRQFAVHVNGDKVKPADRGYYRLLQHIWTYGDQDAILGRCPKDVRHEPRSLESPMQVTGWLGTVKKSGSLKDEAGDNLNRIAIYVRGRMAQEDILDEFSEGGTYADHLVGELTVDEFDKYDGEGEADEDAATSGRQRLVEGDERYRQLAEVVRPELRHIQSRWAEYRTEDGAEMAQEIKEVGEWIEGLSGETRKRARRWLGKLNRIKIEDADTHRQLIKHAVIAFEVHRFNDNLDRLEKIQDEALPAVLDVFTELDSLEHTLYGEIARQRLKVIEKLRGMIEDNCLGKAVQEFLFRHLWLLDPSWEHATDSPVMEKSMRALFEREAAALSSEERKARVDIGFKKIGGDYVIFELKRPSVSIDVHETARQVAKYWSSATSMLSEHMVRSAQVRVVVLVGTTPRGWDNTVVKNADIEMFKSYNARVMSYQELLASAHRSYSEYFEKKEAEVDRLANVIRAIEDFEPPKERSPRS